MADHLDRLAVQGKLPFGGLLEIVTIRPAGMGLAGSQMQITTHRPHARSFRLGLHTGVSASRQGNARPPSTKMPTVSIDPCS